MSPSIGYWDQWKTVSSNWKPSVEFLYPFGRDYPAAFAPLEPLFAELGALRGVDVVPIDWIRLTWLRVGFLGPTGLSAVEVETFHEASGVQLRKIDGRPVRLGGIELVDNRVTLKFDDGGIFREARAAAARGLAQADAALRQDPAMTRDGDMYMPVIDLAYLDGTASDGAVVQAIDPYRAVDLGEVNVGKLMLAHVISQPETHYAYLDIWAEIILAGQRAGARS